MNTANVKEVAFDLTELRAAYDDGLRPTALITEVLRRIASGPRNVWLARFEKDELMKRAAALDARWKDRERLPLFGVPLAVKDNIDVAGLPTTAGCPAYAYQPKQSAYVVGLLVAAGALPIGKTHLDQFATGLVGTRHPDGPCANAFVPEFISGGSSSGSAVATALGHVAFALGTDTAGSGRIPAALNDLVGIKPTKGLLSTRGVVPACRSLDCVSIFAKTVTDARQILATAAAFDRHDAFARPAPTYQAPVHRTGVAFQFGIPRGDSLELDPVFQKLWHKTISRLEQHGGVCVEIDFRPFREAAELLYGGPWLAERYAAVGDFIQRRPAGEVLPVTREIILKGAHPSAVDVFRAGYRLAELRRKTEELRARLHLDFVLTPTYARAYRIREVLADPIRLNTDLGLYTNFMNLLDLAAIAAPAGRRGDGLPWGVTLFSDAGSDERLLDFAEILTAGRETNNVAPPADRFRTDQLEPIVVCGAHMSGMALNHQLLERGGKLLRKTRTAPVYRFYALPGAVPRPGLIRKSENEISTRDDRAPRERGVACEVWGLPRNRWADFIAGIPAPLGIGTVELSDGTSCKGFICEGFAATIPGALDITRPGDWRRFMRSRNRSGK